MLYCNIDTAISALHRGRRRRFLKWFHERYGYSHDARRRFIEESARAGYPTLTKARVSQLFADDEPFGESAAMALADRFGLPLHFFLDDRLSLSPDVWEIAVQLESITDPRAREVAIAKAYRAAFRTHTPAPAPRQPTGRPVRHS